MNGITVDTSPTKDKKKSFFERFFQFASQTMKLNKKSSNVSGSSKKKFKNSVERSTTTPSIKLDLDENATCTFCDYCDERIFTKLTGQSIVYHESCKQKGLNSIRDIDYLDDLETSKISSDLLVSLSSRTLSTAFSTSTSTTMPLSTIVSHRSSISSMRSNFLADGDTDSYTFSTVDMSTIKQYGISVRQMAPAQPDQFALATRVAQVHNSRSSDTLVDLPDDLTDLIDIFNTNDQGLFIENIAGQLMGKFRVFINLLRPIKMLLTARPPLTFDHGSDYDLSQATIDRVYYRKEAIFWLPRGTTNLLYINMNCPTNDLISMLLTKFSIQNNPKKFALYEHTIISSSEVEVLKLRPDQLPLKIMLSWCVGGKQSYEDNLRSKRFVLQENDSGSIEWNEFSGPELTSFLKIMNQEEEDKKRDIYKKYSLIRAEIDRCIKKLGHINESSA